VKDNSKKTSGGFKDLLKEKYPWHLDGNHTTEQCYQLRRALNDTLEPQHPHDKKGNKKANKGNDDFQELDKTVNVLFGGLPNRRALLTVYFGAPSMTITLWFGFDYGTNPPLGTLII
jgi:hypothetical protein